MNICTGTQAKQWFFQPAHGVGSQHKGDFLPGGESIEA